MTNDTIFNRPLVDGNALESSTRDQITNPYDGSVIAEIHQATAEQASKAIETATSAFETTRKMPRHQRAEILTNLAQLIENEKEYLSNLIAVEAGKPLVDAQGEVARAVLNCQGAAEEAKRTVGEEVPLDMDGDVARYQNMVTTNSARTVEEHRDRLGIAKKYPIGPILAIAPFNFPLNLALHKVAPAIAAGNTVILKPSPQAPLTGLRLGQLILEAGMPPGGISVLPCSNEVAETMVTDDRIAMVSFTGSAAVGWHIKRLAYKKRVTLELGGNGGVIIDDTSDQIEYAAKRCARGANVYAGQYCIGVQRIIVHKNIYSDFMDLLLKETTALSVGNPLDTDMDLGPVIDRKSAHRIQSWLNDAQYAGARVETGGNVDNTLVQPTILTNTHRDMKVEHEEIFGPVCTVKTFEDWDEGINLLNDSQYGLQSGIFTSRLDRALDAVPRIESGGVLVNDVPIYRIDNMPFGGFKNSGFGLEGTKYAIDSMMATKFFALSS